MLKRDRQSLLDDLGDQRVEVGWDPFMAVAIGMCAYMAMLFLVGPWLAMLLTNDKDARLAIWVLLPLPFTIAAGFWYRHQNIQRKILFSKEGFEFLNHEASTFACRWDEIQGMKKFRQTLTIAKKDGTSVKVVIPQVKSSRNKSWFNAIVETYLPPEDAKDRAKKLAKYSLAFSLICLTLAIVLGRPRMMNPDQEIPFALMDYIHLGVWAFAATGAFIGSIGILGFLEALGSGKAKGVPPEPQNAFEVRVEKNFGWLETIELMPDRKYRYSEPETLKKALQSQRKGLFAIPILLVVVMIVLSVMILSDPKSEVAGLTFLAIFGLLVLLLIVSLVPSYLRYATGAFLVDDEFSLDGDFLLVHNLYGVKQYDWRIRRSVGEVTKVQGMLAPFSKIEWIGSKPERYMIDRRFLVECDTD